MSKLTLIKQVWWPNDTDGQRADKLARLMGMLQSRPAFPIEIEVQRHQKKRTPKANNYLWGVCYVYMADASGYEKDELHYAMCCKYFGTKVVEIMGEKTVRPIRTTTTNEDGEAEWLGSGDFAEFVDFVIREASNWYDVSIPPPSPQEVPRDGR